MDSSGQYVELILHCCSSSCHSQRLVLVQTTVNVGDQRFSVSGSSYVIVHSDSLESNSETVEFPDVGDGSHDKDGLVDIIGTLKKHTKKVGVDLDGDNVAIGEITADADEDNQIK